MSETVKLLNALFAEGKYQEFIDKIIKSSNEFDPATYYYNLGTAYAKLGNFGAGRYNLERSYIEGNISDELLNNLSFVRGQIGVADMAMSGDLLDQFFYWIVGSPAWLLQSCLGLFIALLLIIVVFAPISKIKSSLVAIALSVAVIFSVNSMRDRYQLAVALEEIPLKEGAAKVFEDYGSLPNGALVLLRKSPSGWYQIIRPYSLMGWTKSNKLGFL